MRFGGHRLGGWLSDRPARTSHGGHPTRPPSQDGGHEVTTFLVFAGSILVLVGVHEAGHFLVARAFGVYIKEFAIGFGPKLFAFRGKETQYALRLIPFGGYVKMAGEDQLEQNSVIPSHRMLYSKPPYARALISLAGPMTNLAFAFLITLAVLWALSFPVMQVSDVVPGTPAASTLQFGDRILEMQGRRILTRDQITDAVAATAGRPLQILLERDGDRRTVSIQPEFVP
ncbi:MAG TPA: PDZ domain-containing protein, partial [Candidatus Acetothermia bacterium]|nr:PDZ domain-containing protein [Candidatus Acetothermia bacterium]